MKKIFRMKIAGILFMLAFITIIGVSVGSKKTEAAGNIYYSYFVDENGNAKATNTIDNARKIYNNGETYYNIYTPNDKNDDKNTYVSLKSTGTNTYDVISCFYKGEMKAYNFLSDTKCVIGSSIFINGTECTLSLRLNSSSGFGTYANDYFWEGAGLNRTLTYYGTSCLGYGKTIEYFYAPYAEIVGIKFSGTSSSPNRSLNTVELGKNLSENDSLLIYGSNYSYCENLFIFEVSQKAMVTFYSDSIVSSGNGLTLNLSKKTIIKSSAFVNLGSVRVTYNYMCDSDSKNNLKTMANQSENILLYPYVNFEDINVTINSSAYTGSAISLSESQIKQNTIPSSDFVLNTTYTISSYKNNTNAGTATVTLSGKAQSGTTRDKVVIKGEKSVNFTINPANLSNAEIKISSTEFIYNGTTYKPDVSYMSFNDIDITNKKIYNLDINYLDANGTTATKNIGSKTMTITGKGNFTGTRSFIYSIKPLNLTNSGISYTLSSNSFVYDGNEHKPNVTVKYNNANISSSDYKIDYSADNTVGTKHITITGVGDNVTGSYDKTYAITPLNVNTLDDSCFVTNECIYNGKEQTPYVKIVLPNGNIINNDQYTVAYSNNINAGTATITVTGKGNLTGTTTRTFEIKKKDVTLTANNQSYTYEENKYINTDNTAYVIEGLISGHRCSNVGFIPESSNVIENGYIKLNDATIRDNSDNDVTGNYNITYVDGVLNIYNGTLNVTLTDYNSEYDGNFHSFTIVAPDDSEVTYYLGDTEIFKPSYKNVCNETITVVVKKDNYNDYREDVNITITAKPVTIEAKDQSYVYGDGELNTEVGNNTIEVTGLLDDDYIASGEISSDDKDVTNNGEITVSKIVIKNDSDEVVTNNYDISYKSGVLTIEEGELDISFYNYEGEYDGQAHSIWIVNNSDIEPEIYYSLDGESFSTTLPEFVNVTDTVEIFFTYNEDNYREIYDSRTVKINKRDITIEAKDQTYQYKNESLNTRVCEDTIGVTGLCEDDTVYDASIIGSTESVTQNGKITVSNAKIKNAKEEDVTDNYNITYIEGSLVITVPPTPAPTATPEPTPEPTVTPNPTATPAPTKEPSVTEELTPSPTVTPTPTKEPSATEEPTPNPTVPPAPTKEPSATEEPTPSPTVPPTPTKEPSATEEPTPNPTVTPTPTKEPSATEEPTPSPTVTPTPTKEPTKEPSVTKEPVIIPTISSTPTPITVPTIEAVKITKCKLKNNNIVIEFTKSSNASGYLIYKANILSNGTVGKYELIHTISSRNITEFSDEISKSGTYSYMVKAYGFINKVIAYSVPSNQINEKVPKVLFKKPSVTVKTLKRSNNKVIYQIKCKKTSGLKGLNFKFKGVSKNDKKKIDKIIKKLNKLKIKKFYKGVKITLPVTKKYNMYISGIFEYNNSNIYSKEYKKQVK